MRSFPEFSRACLGFLFRFSLIAKHECLIGYFKLTISVIVLVVGGSWGA